MLCYFSACSDGLYMHSMFFSLLSRDCYISVVSCNIKFLGSGALGTSLKCIWTFSIILIFIHIYSVTI